MLFNIKEMYIKKYTFAWCFHVKVVLLQQDNITPLNYDSTYILRFQKEHGQFV